MMQSPILGAFQTDTFKRTVSVLDQEYDLMGLSRNNAVEEGDFFLDQHHLMEDSAPLLDDHMNVDLVGGKDNQGFVVDLPQQFMGLMPTETLNNEEAAGPF